MHRYRDMQNILTAMLSVLITAPPAQGGQNSGGAPIDAPRSLSASSPEDGGASDDNAGERPVAPAEEILDLGGDADAPRRQCPTLSVSPEAFFSDYMLAVNKVADASTVPYHSCHGECQTIEGKQKLRLARLGVLVPSHSNALYYGKAGPASFHALADKLVNIGAEAEWSTLAGLDCNGFTHQYAQQNGWTWAGLNVDPPSYAQAPHVQTTGDICPGDFIVYTGVRHVAVVGERLGVEVVDGMSLATFIVYESAADGTPKGLQKRVQGFDIRGTEKFKLYHHNQPSRTKSNDVVVVPGSKSL